jgi:hypothetical protein
MDLDFIIMVAFIKRMITEQTLPLSPPLLPKVLEKGGTISLSHFSKSPWGKWTSLVDLLPKSDCEITLQYYTWLDITSHANGN